MASLICETSLDGNNAHGLDGVSRAAALEQDRESPSGRALAALGAFLGDLPLVVSDAGE